MPRDLFAEHPQPAPRDLFAGLPHDAGAASALAATDPGKWETPGEGVPGVPIISDITRSLYPFERNTATGEYRAAVPKAFTSMTDSLLSAIFAPSDALAGRLSDVEIDPSTGAVLPFNQEMTSRAADMAGWATGGEGIPSRAAMIDNATGRVIPRQVRRALAADSLPMDEVARHVMGMGPEAVVADVGHNVRALAGATAGLPGERGQHMIDSMVARRAAGNARIRAGLDDTLGEAIVPAEVQRDLRAGKRALGPEYETALQGAPPVDASGLATNLDTQIANLRGPAQTVLRDIRGMLDDIDTGELSTDPSVLFQVRQAIDGMAEGVEDPNVSRVLTSARNQVNDLLVQAAPGIQAVDSKYRELSRQGAALDNGQAALDSDRNAPRPEELARSVEAGALPQGVFIGPSGEAFRLSQGARAEIERIVGTNANDRAALERLLKGEGDWNRRRLEILFGPERAAALFDIVANERRMSQTEAAVLQGAGRRNASAAADGIGEPTHTPGMLESVANLRMGTAAAKAARNVLGSARRAGREQLRNDIVDVIMGRGDWSAPITERRPVPAVGAPIAGQANPVSDEDLYRAVIRM